ncbi:unnamed protein product, partial [Ascophyllum nodosum]
MVHISGNTTFVGNKATDNGGAIYASDSSVYVESGTLFLSNVASTGSGGGVYVSSSVMAFSGTVFKENRGATGGGVASFSSGSMLDEESGGTDFTFDQETFGFGPSIITGCRFDGNTATDGGAFYTAA